MLLPHVARLCLLVVLYTSCPLKPVLAQHGSDPSPVVVSRVLSARHLASKSFVGSLVPLKRSPIGSAVDGRVVRLFVDEGDEVTVDESTIVNGEPLGQALVQLRTVSLDIEIEAAQVELLLRQQAEKELQDSLPLEIEVAESKIEEIKARLKFSKDKNLRLQNLFESGRGVSRQEVDEAYSTYLSHDQLNIGSQTLLKKLIATRDSRLMQARFRVKAQEAEIKRLRELKDKYTIRAPFSGYVTIKQTELGRWVSRGDTVLEIIQLDPIELVVPIPQAYIQAVHEALEKNRARGSKLMAHVSVESLPYLLEGEVIQSVPQADLRSRSFPLKIRLANPKTPSGHLLKAGMLARASMFLGSDEDILLVKKDALVLGIRQKSVYVVSRDAQSETSIARQVLVDVGASIEDWIQILGDVQPGDQVVVEGNERLQSGQPIVVSKEQTDTLPEQIGAK